MRKLAISVVVVLFAAALFGCGSGGSGGKVLVVVGGEKITQGDLDLLASINPRLRPQMDTEFGKRKIIENLIEQDLFYQASIAEGLNKTPVVKDKIDIYKRVIISQAYMDQKMEEAARKYYDSHKNEFEKLKMSHIEIDFRKGKKTVRSEKAALNMANQAKKEIDSGKAFAKVAEDMSEDTMTSRRGGDLGFVSKDEPRLKRRGYEPLVEKAYTMKVGQVSGPIKTNNAYHVITVTKASELQPFDAVAQKILFKVRGEAKNQALEDLKKKYKIEYVAADLKENSKPKIPKTLKQKRQPKRSKPGPRKPINIKKLKDKGAND